MEKKKNKWLKFVAAGVIACAVFVLFLIFLFLPVLTKENSKGQKEAGKEQGLPQFFGLLPRKAELGMPKDPEFKPFFSQDSEKIKNEIMERIHFLTNPIIPNISSPNSVFRQDLQQVSRSKKTISDEEWFKIAYPDYFLAAAAEMEKVMRLKGFLDDSEIFEFKTEKDVLIFLNKVVDFGLKEKIISDMQADNFKNGINVVLPALHAEEKLFFEQQISALFLKIFNVAHAEEVVRPECYRGGAGGGKAGSNTWAPCCRCGYYCAPYCIYRDDCGEGGGSCTIQTGCLNSVCRAPKPAIWDPMTGICGC